MQFSLLQAFHRRMSRDYQTLQNKLHIMLKKLTEMFDVANREVCI